MRMPFRARCNNYFIFQKNVELSPFHFYALSLQIYSTSQVPRATWREEAI